MKKTKLPINQSGLFDWSKPYVDGEYIDRPKVRSECENGIRPCPFVSCRYHLYLQVPKLPNGNVKINHECEPDELETSCALDVADEGPHTLEEIANFTGLTRERVRQIEEMAFDKIYERNPDYAEYLLIKNKDRW